MQAVQDLIQKLDEQYLPPNDSTQNQKASYLSDLGYMPDIVETEGEVFNQFLNQAYQSFSSDLKKSELIDSPTQKRLKALYPVEFELKLLEMCLDIDEGITFKNLPAFGDQDLKTRILHYRLNLLGLYSAPISAYFSAASYNGLSKAASFTGKTPLATANLLADIQKFTVVYLKNRGYKHPVVIMQLSEAPSTSLEKYTGAFKRAVKRELSDHEEVFDELKQKLFKRNDDKLEVQYALELLHSDDNGFIIRLIQVHQWIAGFYQGNIDGEVGEVTLDSLQDVISSYNESGESVDEKRTLVSLPENDKLLAFNAIFFLNKYKIEQQQSDKTINTLEAVNNSYQSASTEDQQQFETTFNQQWNNIAHGKPTSAAEHKGFLQRIFGGIKAFFKKAFRFARKIFSWILKGIKKVAGFITNFLKKLYHIIKEAAQHFIEGVRFLLGKTTILTNENQQSLITHFDVDKDVLNLGTQIDNSLLKSHLGKVDEKVNSLKFSLTLIAFLFKTIRAILMGGIVAWPVFLFKLAKSFKQVIDSYKQIATT